MPHRLLLVIPSLAQGGAERQILELARRLDPGEFAITLCTLNADEHYAAHVPPSLRRIDLGWNKRPRREAFRALVDLLRAEKPDLIQTYMDQANLWVRLAGAVAKNIPIVTSVRGPWMRWRYLALESLLASKVGRAVVVNSRSTETEMLEWAGVPRDKLFLIHNFLDLETFRPASDEQKQAARARFGLGRDDLVYLLSGRQCPQKHHLGLALVLGRLRARGLLPENLKIVLAGRARDKWYARWVDPAFRAARVSSFIHSVGTIAAADIPSLYAATDVLLLPSLWEGLANVSLEAQACGIPAVVTDKANMDDIIEHERTGFVAPLELGMDGYTDALGRMLALPAEARAEMGRQGRARMETLFDPARVLGDYQTLYRTILNEPAAVQSA